MAIHVAAVANCNCYRGLLQHQRLLQMLQLSSNFSNIGSFGNCRMAISVLANEK